MDFERRPTRCVSLGLDAALLRRVRAAVQVLGIDVTEEGSADSAGAADVVLVAVPPHSVGEVLDRGARAVVACVPHGDGEGAARAFADGVDDLITPRMQGAEVAARLRSVVQRAEARRRDVLALRLSEDRSAALVGRSPSFLRMRRIVENVAITDVPVRVHGESGSGRGVVARALHGLSSRRDRPLFVLDAVRLGADEVHADLFGDAALRGATARDPVESGALWTARDSTVLVRSVDQLPDRTQTALAQWVRTRTLPEGPHAGEAAAARLVVTAGEPADGSATSTRMHPELAAALASLAVRVPPLRERPGDAALLLTHFVQLIGRSLPPLEDEAAALLDRHHWPGNVREVAAVAALLSLRPHVASLSASDLAPLLAATEATASLEGVESLRDVARRHVIRVVALAGGARGRAAKALGISRRTLYNHLRDTEETSPPRQP